METPLQDTRETVETDYKVMKFDLLADAVAAGRLTMQEAEQQFREEFWVQPVEQVI